MKLILGFTIILLAISGCTSTPTEAVMDAAGTDIPQPGLPNPASVNCTEKGNKLEIRTADDGSQYGMCVFPDGNSCEEWAYFRGECDLPQQVNPTPDLAVEATPTPTNNGSGGFMQPGTAEEISNWWGVVKKTEPGAQFDDYFERQDIGQIIFFGIDSMDPAVKEQIETIRDSGKIVHLYGILLSNVPDYNGSQIQVDRIEVEE